MYISPLNGTGGFKILPYLKYDNALKQENRLTLGPNTDKNNNYLKKSLK